MPASPTVYFDPNPGSPDLELLPKHLRESDELPGLADVVLADIVAHFTTSTYNGPAYAWRETEAGWVLDGGPLAGMVKVAEFIYVALRGYAVDASLASAEFREAMRREVGMVLRWRLPQARRGPGVTSESDGDVSRTFADNAGAPFPPTFPHYLRPFVVSEEVWTL